jgi:hypothetical protein
MVCEWCGLIYKNNPAFLFFKDDPKMVDPNSNKPGLASNMPCPDPRCRGDSGGGVVVQKVMIIVKHQAANRIKDLIVDKL